MFFQFQELICSQAFGDKDYFPTTKEEIFAIHSTPAYKLYDKFVDIIHEHFGDANTEEFKIVVRYVLLKLEENTAS